MCITLRISQSFPHDSTVEFSVDFFSPLFPLSKDVEKCGKLTETPME